MKIYNFEGKRNIIGSRVNKARIKLGLSQNELAAKLQVEGVQLEQKSISRIEVGERFVADYELLMLANILKVDVKWLLTGKTNWLTLRVYNPK